MAAKAKTLFHDALVILGPKRVTVGDVFVKDGAPSKVALAIDGQVWLYSCDNEGCAEFFRGHKGKTFTVVAEGKAATARLTYVGEPGQETPPPVVAAQPKAADPRKLVPGGTKQELESLVALKAFVQRNATVAKVALKAFKNVCADYQAVNGMPVPPDIQGALYGTLLYGCNGQVKIHDLPRWCDPDTLQAMVPEKPAVAAKPKCPKHPAVELDYGGKCHECAAEAFRAQAEAARLAAAPPPPEEDPEVPF